MEIMEEKFCIGLFPVSNGRKEIIPCDGYEVISDNGKFYVVKKLPQYPKTSDECREMLGIPKYMNIEWQHPILGYKIKLLADLQKLLICRDAYWKIAGEEMRLNKSWKPDWRLSDKRKYCIVNTEGNITKWVQKTTNKILAFPTEEMRDAFYENFKELIQQCKELL